GLGVAVAHQDAAGAGAQREDVAGPDQVGGFGGAARQQPEGGGAVGGGDSGGDAVGGGGVDGDGEGGLHRLGVVVHHLRQPEAVQFVALHGGADQAAALAHHEGDDLGGGHLGRDDEVALVLAVLVVDDDDRPAGRDVGDGLLDRVERQVLGVVEGRWDDGAGQRPAPLLRGGLVEGAGGWRAGAHAGAPSRAGRTSSRERSHQSRSPHRTSAP